MANSKEEQKSRSSGTFRYGAMAVAVAVAAGTYSYYDAHKAPNIFYRKIPFSSIDVSLPGSLDIVREKVVLREPVVIQNVFNNSWGVPYPGLPDDLDVPGHEWVLDNILHDETCGTWRNARPLYIDNMENTSPILKVLVNIASYMAYGEGIDDYSMRAIPQNLGEFYERDSHKRDMIGKMSSKSMFEKLISSTRIAKLFDTEFFVSTTEVNHDSCVSVRTFRNFGNELTAKLGAELEIVNKGASLHGFAKNSHSITLHWHRVAEEHSAKNIPMNIWSYQMMGKKQWSLFHKSVGDAGKIGTAYKTPGLTVYPDFDPFRHEHQGWDDELPPRTAHEFPKHGMEEILGYRGITEPGDFIIWDVASIHDLYNDEGGYLIGGIPVTTDKEGFFKKY